MERFVGIVRRDDNSDFGVEFPDLPGCITAASSIEELEWMGAEALRLHLDGLAEEGLDVPAPRSADALLKEHEGDFGQGFLMLLTFEAEPVSNPPVRINVSLPEVLVASIDESAANVGMTRSGWLAEAARKVLGAGPGMTSRRKVTTDRKPRNRKRKTSATPSRESG